MCECERGSRIVIVFQRAFGMNLIVQRIMTAAAALSVSALIAACGAHSTNPSNETFTVYEDAPKMSLLDLGQPGNSPGDVYHFSAPLRSGAGGQITARCSVQRL